MRLLCFLMVSSHLYKRMLNPNNHMLYLSPAPGYDSIACLLPISEEKRLCSQASSAHFLLILVIYSLHPKVLVTVVRFETVIYIILHSSRPT